jgi:hypothetical protein
MSNTVEPGKSIDLSKVSARSIAACLVAEGLDPAGEIEDTAKRLAKHFAMKDDGEDFYMCTECKAPFPGRFTVCCPFCAIDDDGKLVEGVLPSTYGASPEDDAKMPVEPGVAVDEKTKKIQERAKKKKEAVEAKQPKPAKPAPVPTMPVIEAVIEPTREEKAKDEEKRVIALAKREEKIKLARAGEADLDAAVEEIRRLKSGVATAHWELGRKLLEVYDSQLYKQRCDADGKPGVYKTAGFEGWVRAECGFTVANAFLIMDVAKHFTREEVEVFGYSKLGLALKAPTPEQTKLLVEAVKSGGTYQEIKQAVEKMQAENPVRRAARDGTRRGQNINSGRKKVLAVPGGEVPDKLKKHNVISIATIPKRQRIAIMAKPAKRGEAPRPAKKLTDEPFFTMEFENEVVMKFTISHNAQGELQVICEAKRLAESAADADE